MEEDAPPQPPESIVFDPGRRLEAYSDAGIRSGIEQGLGAGSARRVAARGVL